MKKSHIGSIGLLTITAYLAAAGYGYIKHEDCNHNHSSPHRIETEIQPDTTYVTQTTKPIVEVPLVVEAPLVITPPSMDSLIYAMIQVESRGDDSAYCASEDAVGCLQIRPIMVKEVNRICKRLGIKKTYTLQDRWSRPESIQMLKIFARFYKLNSFEDVARCWNGGPKGMTYASTEGYWNRVQSEMI